MARFDKFTSSRWLIMVGLTSVILMSSCATIPTEDQAAELLEEAIANTLQAGQLKYTGQSQFLVSGIPVQIMAVPQSDTVTMQDLGNQPIFGQPALTLQQLQEIDKQISVRSANKDEIQIQINIDSNNSRQWISNLLTAEMDSLSNHSFSMQNEYQVSNDSLKMMREEMEHIRQTYTEKMNEALQSLKAATEGDIKINRKTNLITHMFLQTNIKYIVKKENKEETWQIEYAISPLT